MELTRNHLVKELPNIREEYLELSPVEKLITITPYVKVLSLFNDDEVISLMESFEVTRHVTKYFIFINDIFKDLGEYFEKSMFLVPYEVVMKFYMSYSRTFFMVQLSYNFGFDMNEISKKMGRQEKNGNLPNVFDNHYDFMGKMDKLMKKEAPELTIPFNEKGIVSNIKKHTKFHRKIGFNNLYKTLLKFNRDANLIKVHEPDFKFEFYDLFKILIRDKSLFKDDEEKQLSYGKPGNRRFMIKRVEYLILS